MTLGSKSKTHPVFFEPDALNFLEFLNFFRVFLDKGFGQTLTINRDHME